MKLRALTSALLLGLTTCGLSSGPEEQVAGAIRVKVGEEAAVPGSVVRIAFSEVASDSRCPVGVACVWQGDAAVHVGLTAGTGPTQLFVLHTGIDPRSVDFAGLRVTLVDLVPYPREGQPIAPEDYTAGFDVEPVTP